MGFYLGRLDIGFSGGEQNRIDVSFFSLRSRTLIVTILYVLFLHVESQIIIIEFENGRVGDSSG